jgi:hypothetical protein
MSHEIFPERNQKALLEAVLTIAKLNSSLDLSSNFDNGKRRLAIYQDGSFVGELELIDVVLEEKEHKLRFLASENDHNRLANVFGAIFEEVVGKFGEGASSIATRTVFEKLFKFDDFGKLARAINEVGKGKTGYTAITPFEAAAGR